MCNNFKQNIGLKEHITAVHEERDSIVINVAKILLEDAICKCTQKLFMKKTLNSIVITVAKISPKIFCQSIQVKSTYTKCS